MIRDTLTAGSKYSFIGVNGSGAYYQQRRTSTGGSTGTATSGSGTPPNIWVRVTRSNKHPALLQEHERDELDAGGQPEHQHGIELLPGAGGRVGQRDEPERVELRHGHGRAVAGR